MSHKFLVVFFAIFLQGILYAQSNYKNTIKYIDVNGTEEQYSNAIEQLYSLLKQQYSNKEVANSKWQAVKDLRVEAIGDIKQRLVPAYESYFSEKEINEMYDFYLTDAGKQMAINRNELSKKELKQVQAFYNTATGLKIQENAEALGKTISDISTEWSHLLYVEAKNILE